MTVAEASTEDLTSSANFDINDYIDRAIAAAAEEPDDTSLGDAADGPESDEDSGELTADTAVDAEATEIEQTEEAPVEEPAEEPAAEAAQATEAPAPAPEAKPDPRDAEIAALKDLVAQSQQAIRDLVAVRQQPEKPQPPQSKVSEDAVRLALFGGAEGSEAWKALNPTDRAEAERVAREYFKREAKAAVDPAARYQEIRDQVLADLSEVVAPLVQDFYDRQASQTFQTIAAPVIKDPADKKRLQELYSQQPGSRGKSLAEQKAALQTAVERLEIERAKKALEAREQKLTAKQLDQVNRKPPSKVGSVRRSDAPNNKRPVMGKDENILDFYNRLAAYESAGA